MELDALLTAHGFMRVERPPELWEVDAELDPFIRMLGELLAFGLRWSKELSELTLNVSNVVVEADSASEHWPAGEYVAVTVKGSGDWDRDLTWWPGAPRTFDMFGDLDAAAEAAGVVYGYVRALPEGGSITMMLPRL